jgi:Oxidoreductase family, NAD-binding Rossmann fold/Oxidoreductase family, C-terminal alpha/beta domain
MHQSNIIGSGGNWSRRRFLQSTALATSAATLGFPNLLHARGASGKLNVAHIGLGAMGRGRLSEMLGSEANIIAICDVDENQFIQARKMLANLPFKPSEYVDFRTLLEKEKNLDGVVVTTPDHWHALIATAALKAGKHVFCEKPLAHTVGEARALRTLAKKHSKQVTQMGNQGSADPSLRRSIEIIQAGALGEVHEVHCWVRDGAGCHAGLAMPLTGDPIPAGLHWDGWLGPAPRRAYKKDYYHPWNWRGWYDFGNGVMADFGCHNLNLPFRALKLDYARRIEAEGELTGLPTYSNKNHIRFHFDQRGELAPLIVHWYDQGLVPDKDVVPAELIETLGESPKMGVLIVGENGYTYGDPWNGAKYIKLKDDEKIASVLNHPGTKAIPESLPRTSSHVKEWVGACTGGPATFSSFEVGGHLTEIALSGIVALRTMKTLEWDGERMRAENAPEAQKFVQPHYRRGWAM